MNKKRYTTEDQIIKDIDKCHKNAGEIAKEAERLDIEADTLFKLPDGKYIEDAKHKRWQAQRLRLRANNMINKKAKKLGVRLSELRTPVLGAITDDQSVPVSLKSA